jgi:hypothetical protein
MVQRINWIFSEAGNVEASQTLAMLIACDTHHLTAAFWQLPPPNALDTSVLNQPSERARNLSLYRRLMMRTLIGQYLHVSATEVLVDYHGNGGLRLLSPAVPLYLSVSQRGDVAGLAVSSMEHPQCGRRKLFKAPGRSAPPSSLSTNLDSEGGLSQGQTNGFVARASRG